DRTTRRRRRVPRGRARTARATPVCARRAASARALSTPRCARGPAEFQPALPCPSCPDPTVSCILTIGTGPMRRWDDSAIPVQPARDLGPLFDPRAVAVVGASNDPAKWGHWLARGALMGEHRRDVFLVNRSGGEVLGRRAFASLAELPNGAELVAVGVPASAVVGAGEGSAAARGPAPP